MTQRPPASSISSSLTIMALIAFSPMADLGQAAERTWPHVAPMMKSFTFPKADDASAQFQILSKDGIPLYEVECHTAYYEGDRDFDYSGDFECRLTALYEKQNYSTLFTDNPKQSHDWESRARVFAEELMGACGDYPEYGRVRHFRLRGMEITLEFTEIRFWARQEGHPTGREHLGLASFRLDATVEPDTTALSAITEPVPFVEPPFANPEKDFSLKCDVVIKS